MTEVQLAPKLYLIIAVDFEAEKGAERVAPPKKGHTFMVEVVIPPAWANEVLRLAMIQERDAESTELPWHLRGRRDLRGRWRDFGIARLQIRDQCWQVYRGGISFKIDNEHHIIAFIKDEQQAETIRQFDMSKRKGSVILQLVEGSWYAWVKFNAVIDGKRPSRQRYFKRENIPPAKGPRQVRGPRYPRPEAVSTTEP